MINKMPINKIVKDGDVFSSRNTPNSLIVHGCNAQGAYGSGVAGQMCRLAPEARFAYLREAKNGLSLGQIIPAKKPHSDNIWVINGITQEFYGTNKNVCYASMLAIRDVMIKTLEFARIHRITEIHMPLIGAGLANGDWTIIEGIIDSVLGIETAGNPSNSSSLPLDVTYTIWHYK